MLMCGIVGYVGNKDAQEVLLGGLGKLEYRGYDSAGIAINSDSGISLEKKSGKLQVLVDALLDHSLSGKVGIGHTRWATHGQPTDNNAHPHVSANKRFAVVHNGIIENYQDLKDTYLEDVVFTSETDSEVLAHLLDVFYDGDMLKALEELIEVIKGSYALVILEKDHPEELYVARQGSPLVIGVGEHENFVASDVLAVLSHTKQCIYLESGQYGRLTAENIEIYDEKNQLVKYQVETITWDEQSAKKDGYEHFMLKEIYEQPEAFRQVLMGRISESSISFDEFTMTKEDINQWQQIYIVACGTAYHSGLVGKKIIEKVLDIPVFVDVASEFRYGEPRIDDKTLVIVISQSGETADTLEAMREAKKQGANTLAITNVVGSSIAREAERVVYLWAGPEISVASTKAYTAMLIALYLLAFYMGSVSERINLSENTALLSTLMELPDIAESFLTEEYIETISEASQMLVGAEDIFYIGRGMDWAIAEEGALKLKEISYIHAEAYPAGELKHGTLALITPETPVVAIALQEKTLDKILSNVQEVSARGAKVIGLVKEKDVELLKDQMICVVVPDVLDFIIPVIAAVPLQLLAYFTAKNLGRDIDQPRNLAKSVTVE